METFYNEELSVLYTIQTSGVVFRGEIECQLRKYFFHQSMSYNSKNERALAEFFLLYKYTQSF